MTDLKFHLTTTLTTPTKSLVEKININITYEVVSNFLGNYQVKIEHGQIKIFPDLLGVYTYQEIDHGQARIQ